MKTNKIARTLPQNQKRGSRIGWRIGTRNIPAMPKKITPNTGSVYLSNGRAGLAAWKKQIRPLRPKISVGRKPDPYCTGHRGCQPPRKSSVATQETVTMFAYSAMKNDANFMLEYSV